LSEYQYYEFQAIDRPLEKTAQHGLTPVDGLSDQRPLRSILQLFLVMARSEATWPSIRGRCRWMATPLRGSP